LGTARFDTQFAGCEQFFDGSVGEDHSVGWTWLTDAGF
jgi:hypothetical protein